MRPLTHDTIKYRLTDRADIAVAVTYLISHGIPADAIAVELSRLFYVDIDELNAVLKETEPAAGSSADKPEARARVA